MFATLDTSNPLSAAVPVQMITTMPRYRAVIFDLFGTLALWDPNDLPKFRWRGKSIPSTMGELQHRVAELVDRVDFDTFYASFLATNEALQRERDESGREIPSRDRFQRTLIDAGYEDDLGTRDIAEQLSLAHMDLLSRAVEIPADYARFLADLGERYPIALLSNFDHAPTARNILERGRVSDLLDPIVISDEHGWRKPHARIFEDTLDRIGVSAADALFVGDSAADDVAGAAGVGMDVAWINARRSTLPTDSPLPTYELTAITELTTIL